MYRRARFGTPQLGVRARNGPTVGVGAGALRPAKPLQSVPKPSFAGLMAIRLALAHGAPRGATPNWGAAVMRETVTRAALTKGTAATASWCAGRRSRPITLLALTNK